MHPSAAPDPLSNRLSRLAKIAVPVGLAQMGQTLMGVVDVAVVGRVNEETLAAVSLANALFFTIGIFCMGLLMGLDPLIAQALGAKDEARARRFVWQGVSMSMVIGTVFMLPFLGAPALFAAFGVRPEVIDPAIRFLWFRVPSLPAMLIFVVARSYLQSTGHTRDLVVSTVVGNLLNLALDLLFVLGGGSLPTWTGPLRHFPALGAAGAAIATFTVSWMTAAWLLHAVRKVPGPRVPGAFFPIRRPVFDAVTRVGGPIGLHLFAEVVGSSRVDLQACKLEYSIVSPK